MSTTTTWDGAWHPFAQSFALPSEDELREMASSIEEVGQLSPCVMTPDGQGLDGRSRIAACTLAGVEPRWDVFDGDPIAFIITANAARRHLSLGQYAMAIAIGLVDTGKRVNGKGGRRRFKRGSVPRNSSSANSESTWVNRVKQAGVVLDHDRALAEAVLRGDDGVTLDNAYRKADDERKRRDRLKALDEELATLVESGVLDLLDAERRAADERRIDELPDDLAERVREGGLDLDEAELIASEQAKRIAIWVEQIRSALLVLVPMAAPLPPEFKTLLSDEQYASLDAMLRPIRPKRSKP